MPAKRGYLVPETIDPPTAKCVTIFVPDDANWWSAFWGQMTALAESWNWEGTTEQKEQVVAVWMDRLEAARESWLTGDCMDCEDCIESNLRIRVNGQNGAIQTSPDGGITWINMGDTVQYIQTMSPFTDGDEEDIRCAVAANLWIWIMDKWNDVVDQIEVYADSVSASDAVISLFAPAYLIVDQVIDALNEIVEATVGACRAEDTVDRRDAARCWLFCYLPPYGEITQAVWDDFKEFQSTQQQVSPLGQIAMLAYLDMLEFDGILAQARRWAQSTGACGDCSCGFEWAQEFPFGEELSLLGWTTWYSPGQDWTYVEPDTESNGLEAMLNSIPDGGEGTCQISRAVVIYFNFPNWQNDTTIEKVIFEIRDLEPAPENEEATAPFINLVLRNSANGLGSDEHIAVESNMEEEDFAVTFDALAWGSDDVVSMRIVLRVGLRSGVCALPVNGAGFLYHARFEGNGTNPFLTP